MLNSINSKINLMGFTADELKEYFASLSHKTFRAKQVFRWIHQKQEFDFAKMSDLAKDLQSYLIAHAEIKTPILYSEAISLDGVIKWVLEVDDNNKIETVYIPDNGRHTLCISSQVGCALECQFCATGRQGFNRNLTTHEIIGQLWFANSKLAKNNIKISNVVLMGMGEPLANYNNVIKAMQIMLDDNAYNISKRKLTLSTSGMVPKILNLKDDCPVSLAISLHASNDTIRDYLVPINKKYPLSELMESLKSYLPNSPKEFITFEYVMLKNINDKIEHAFELISLVKGIKCKFNLIPFNPFDNSGFETSDIEQIHKFQKILQKAGLVTTIRKTRGDRINAACGQLVGRVKDKTTRQIKWQKLQQLSNISG